MGEVGVIERVCGGLVDVACLNCASNLMGRGGILRAWIVVMIVSPGLVLAQGFEGTSMPVRVAICGVLDRVA